MNVEDKWAELKTLLPDNIVASIEQRSCSTLTAVNESQEELKIRYFGAVGADTASAIKKLSDGIIEASKKYNIQGSLSGSKAIEYHLTTGQIVVVSYLLFNQADLHKIDEELKLGAKNFFNAGETPDVTLESDKK